MADVRVAIVDEHGIVRRGLREVLSRAPGVIVVGEAATSDDATRVISNAQPDVAVVDLAIDHGNHDILATVKDASPHTAVLVFCERADGAHVEAAIAAGASGFLLKTARPAEIVLAVESLADGHIYLHPQVTRAFLASLTGRATEAGIVPVTSREMEILQLIADGMSTDEAASALERSPATIKTHIRSAFKKLGANHRAHAVAEALRLRLIQ